MNLASTVANLTSTQDCGKELPQSATASYKRLVPFWFYFFLASLFVGTNSLLAQPSWMGFIGSTWWDTAITPIFDLSLLIAVLWMFIKRENISFSDIEINSAWNKKILAWGLMGGFLGFLFVTLITLCLHALGAEGAGNVTVVK
ncbi:hypothetical protein ACFL6Y_12115, partial [Elusimicrobiota bacterium]